MLLFSFGKCSLKYLYPFVAGIIWIPIQYMTTILFINSLFDTDFYNFSPLLYSLLDQIGYILVGLFEIVAIYHRRNKAFKNSFCFEFKKRIEKYKSSYKILFLIGALSVPSMFCNMILPTSKAIDNTESFMQINLCCVVQFLIIVNKKSGILTIANDKEKEKTLYHEVHEYLWRKNKNNKFTNSNYFIFRK